MVNIKISDLCASNKKKLVGKSHQTSENEQKQYKNRKQVETPKTGEKTVKIMLALRENRSFSELRREKNYFSLKKKF